MEKENCWYGMTAEEVVTQLQGDHQNGLTGEEALRRMKLVGRNELKEQKKISPWAVLCSQFTDFMVLVLIAATLISGLLGEYADALTILAIVIINAILGFAQEYQAEKSLEALKKMIAPEATVIRNKRTQKIPAAELVPGDLAVLETGDVLAADLRLLEVVQLEISEAALTGESLPVKKRFQEVYKTDVPLGDRKNMGYMGTVVTRGKGLGIVVDTGMCTEMGRIAGYIQQVEDEDTPLQKRLAQLGRYLVLFCLCIVGVVVVCGVLRGEPLHRMILTGVSLAVAAIPEGLPAIVTVSLAIGVQKMVKRQAIVRALPAVETLGCATVICSDKTGTLTQNEMTVRQIYLSEDFIDVTGEGYIPHGKFQFPTERWTKENKNGWATALKVAALCNNSFLQKDQTAIGGLFRKNDRSCWRIVGDPTEGALLVGAAKAGYWREALEKTEKRVAEIPFDSERKRMSVIYQENTSGVYKNYCKGAPDTILQMCDRIWHKGAVIPLTEKIKKEIADANEKMASGALRVLGLAYRQFPAEVDLEDEEGLEKGLVFIALAGMIDPPRDSAKQAVAVCRMAGIKTVMITGDHKNTAEAVAKELKIITDPSQQVVTGTELDKMSDFQLAGIVSRTWVYARVSPKHKLRIVKALKEKGQVVAMTGDGVNDAPAVKEADIGISMGITGTDVTKEASSLILGNDDFATIVTAVEEGRIIYDNIRKFIRYLLSSNVGEVLTMFAATLLGFPLPLLPIQILWMNLVTDGLPAMALGLDAGDPDIMRRRPRNPQESIFAHGLPGKIAVQGTIIAFGTLLVYVIGYYMGNRDLALARTMAFTTLVFAQLFYVFECRSERYSIFELGLFTNMYLVAAVGCSMLMQILVIYLPFFQSLFKTVPLDYSNWIVILCLSAVTSLLQGLYRTVKIRRRSSVMFLRS